MTRECQGCENGVPLDDDGYHRESIDDHYDYYYYCTKVNVDGLDVSMDDGRDDDDFPF